MNDREINFFKALNTGVGSSTIQTILETKDLRSCDYVYTMELALIDLVVKEQKLHRQLNKLQDECYMWEEKYKSIT